VLRIRLSRKALAEHVNLGDSASNPLTILPLSEEEEATEYWQDTEDAERSTTAAEGE
jgi:hypothetical protein